MKDKEKLLDGIESSFDYFVRQHLASYPKVSLSMNKDAQIRSFVKGVVEKKRSEGGQYFKDPKSLAKRYYTGWGVVVSVIFHSTDRRLRGVVCNPYWGCPCDHNVFSFKSC